MDEEFNEHEVLDGEIVLVSETALQAPAREDRTPVKTRPAGTVALAAASGFAVGAAAVALIARRQLRALGQATPVSEIESGGTGNGRTTYLISVRALVSSE